MYKKFDKNEFCFRSPADTAVPCGPLGRNHAESRETNLLVGVFLRFRTQAESQ